MPMKLVVVVEDEFGHREVLQLLLEAEGYRVRAASNGQAALVLLEEETPALILSDFMMPTMTGGELGCAVRRHAALNQVPFVIMSATDEARVGSVFADYDAFLVKPFDIDSLMQLVGRLVASGRPPRAPQTVQAGTPQPLLPPLRVPPAE